jgi:hypothetical protein
MCVVSKGRRRASLVRKESGAKGLKSIDLERLRRILVGPAIADTQIMNTFRIYRSASLVQQDNREQVVAGSSEQQTSGPVSLARLKPCLGSYLGPS